MTKKHFVALAAILKSLKPRIVTTTEHGQWAATVGAQASFCQSQNAQFDRARFLQACGVTTAPSTEVKCRKCGSPLTQQRYCWNEECEYYHKPQKVARTA